MGEEMENGSNRVYRGEWMSEMSQWMGWSSDSPASVKQISSDGPSGSDDSTSFIETKPNYAPPLQFPEFGGPSPGWGPDFLSIRSGLGYNQRYDRIIGVNAIKQEHLSFDLDRHSASFPICGRKIPDMPALFPTTAIGEEEMYNSMPHKVPLTSHSHQLSFYSNSTPLWRGSVEMNGGNQIASGSCEKRPSGGNVAHKDSSSTETKKSNGETAAKRLRSDSPAPFTTFKVRKEKLGDRITALQQLVSPFGKTDTASVLFDAIEYIKLLHDQVTVLSTPYMRLSHERCEGRTDRGGGDQSLRSRGLCLVPISTTLHVAKDNPTDFWAPTFGGSYR